MKYQIYNSTIISLIQPEVDSMNVKTSSLLKWWYYWNAFLIVHTNGFAKWDSLHVKSKLLKKCMKIIYKLLIFWSADIIYKVFTCIYLL